MIAPTPEPQPELPKMRLTVTVDYPADPKSYKRGTTPEQMVAWEIEALKEDPTILTWLAEQPGSNYTVKGEMLP